MIKIDHLFISLIGWIEIKFKIQSMKKNRWKYSSIWKPPKIFIWCCFRRVIPAEKRSDVSLYEPIIEMMLTRFSFDLEEISCWNVDLYEIGGRKGCWRSLIWSDQITKESAVEMIMIEKRWLIKRLIKKSADEVLWG